MTTEQDPRSDGARSSESNASRHGGPIRVLHILPGLDGAGGTERSLVDNTAQLAEHGIETHVALLTERNDLVAEVEERGVVVHDLSGVSSRASRIRRIRGLVSEVDPDVVHAALFSATVPTQLALLDRRVPLLITWANTTYSPQRFAHAGLPRWKIEATRFIERVLGASSGSFYQAVTPGVATSMSKALHARPDRVFVGERGRPDPELSRAERVEQVEEVRCGLGLDVGRPVVLAVGRQEPAKDHEELIRQFDTVAERTGAVLLIAGREGTASQAVRAARGRLRDPEVVRILGQRADVPVLLDIADVFVTSSIYEGAAGAVIEAMAAGVPIVATRLDGLDGVLEDRVNALVAERDADGHVDLASGMIELLEDRDLATRLSTAARALYLDRFTSRRSAESLVAIYRELAGRAGR